MKFHCCQLFKYVLPPWNQEKYLIGERGFGVVVVVVWTAMGRLGKAVVVGLGNSHGVLVEREVVEDSGVVGFAVVTLVVEVGFVGWGFALVIGILPVEVVETNFVVVIVFCVEVVGTSGDCGPIGLPIGVAIQLCNTTIVMTNEAIFNISFWKSDESFQVSFFFFNASCVEKLTIKERLIDGLTEPNDDFMPKLGLLK